jgi:hypothetical protein
MLQVTQLYARSFDLDHLDVFWEIADFNGNIRQYDFYVRRSESPAGPWETLAGPFKDQFLFRDVSPAIMHKWRQLYYQLVVVDTVTNERVEFGPTAQVAEPDLIALEIMRQEDILFREHVGRRCWVFPVRTFGAKCVCFDRVSGRRTKANCLNCFDTGYLGGFLSPIECFVQLDPNGNSPSNTPYGEQQPNNTSARLISFPPLKPKDILIEAENRRWRVVTVNTTQRLRAVVHQEVVLHEVPRGDVEYKLPVNLAELQSLEIAAERNFTNPQHVDGDLDKDLLAVYGYQPRGTAR